MLDKLMSDLNEMNRLAQVYHDNEQWAMLDKMLNKIKIWATMIQNRIENLEVPETIKE